MPNVWWIGVGNEKRLSSADWAAAGVPGVDETVWDLANGWAVDESTLTPAQLAALQARPSEYLLGQTGSRTGITPSGPPAGTAGGIGALLQRAADILAEAKAAVGTVVGKLDRVTTPNRVYVTDTNGNSTTVLFASGSSNNAMMYRNSSGNSSIADPTDALHVTNKRYVDTKSDLQMSGIVNFAGNMSGYYGKLLTLETTADNQDVVAALDLSVHTSGSSHYAKLLVGLRQVGGQAQLSFGHIGAADPNQFIAIIAQESASLTRVDIWVQADSAWQTWYGKLAALSVDTGSSAVIPAYSQEPVVSLPAGTQRRANEYYQRTPITGSVATAAATVIKVANLDAPYSSYVPKAGDLLFLTWTLGATVSNPTLAVNGQAARPISSPNGTSSTMTTVASGQKSLLYFDGATYWYLGAQLNTTYSSATAAELEAGTSTTGRVLPANIAATKLLVRAAAVPASPTATGRAGQFADDGAYLYICTATNTWRRTPLATW